MGRIVITEYVSLDGVMEAPGPGDVEDFRHKAWVFDVQRGPEGDAFKLRETEESAALLLGRVTYETFAAAWPTMSGPMADKLNEMPKYVVSATLREATWTNSQILRGDLETEVRRLRDEVDGDVVVHGSGTLARALLDLGLVDELRLMVYPLLLGEGRRFFGALADKAALELVEATPVGGGIVVLVYAPAGATAAA